MNRTCRGDGIPDRNDILLPLPVPRRRVPLVAVPWSSSIPASGSSSPPGRSAAPRTAPLQDAVLLCRPLVAIEQDNRIDLSTTELHDHDFHQFLYLRSGWCRAILGERSFTIEPGHFTCIPPGLAHDLRFPTPEQASCQVVQIKCWLNPQAGFPEVPEITDCRPIAEQVDACLRLILDAFVARRPLDQDRAIGGQLMYLLGLLGSTAGTGLPSQDQRIRDAIGHIAANLGECISVRHLARLAGLDQSYFSRLFHAQTGASPQSYIRSRRLDRARSLLVFTDASIAAIADSVGYRNYHHFSNQFLALFGLRPSDYREAMRDPESRRTVEPPPE